MKFIIRQEKPECPVSLAEAIEHGIVHRTGRRIRMLKVKVGDNHVAIDGCVASYHLKQLALQGVLHALGP